MQVHSHLTSADLTNKRVFLRADLNVPLENGKITSDFRLVSLKPTLDLLIAKKARIILATHIGRPHGIETHLSTKILIPWFESHGYTIQWIDSLEKADAQSRALTPGTILLLENMRFFEGERSENKTIAQAFAQELRDLAEYYVNDAFALLHRHDTSITLLPDLFKPEDKTIGLLIEKEITTLDRLFHNPEKPFMLILGGGKVKDKLPFLEKLLTKVDSMVILPAMAFTFLKAMGIEVGQSLVNEESLESAKNILQKAQEKGKRIILPTDFLISLDSLEGPLKMVQDIPINGFGIAVGPETLKAYKKELSLIKTVYVNGAMGFAQRPETMQPLYELLHIIANSDSKSIIGGGDSIQAVYNTHLEDRITYCSTGGGASLYFLTYGTLPALKYIIS